MASGSMDEKCIRISICKILSEEKYKKLVDVIISDPSLLTAQSQKMNVRGGVSEFIEEKRDELYIGYKESSGSLQKIDDLSIDLQRVDAQKIADIPRLEQKKDQWELIYRKMIEKPEVEQRFVANILRKTPDEFGMKQPNIKLNLFETNSGL